MNKEKPQLTKEVRDRYKEFTTPKPTADEWIEWAMNKGIEPDAVIKLDLLAKYIKEETNDGIQNN